MQKPLSNSFLTTISTENFTAGNLFDVCANKVRQWRKLGKQDYQQHLITTTEGARQREEKRSASRRRRSREEVISAEPAENKKIPQLKRGG